jgi:hypothetical protein
MLSLLNSNHQKKILKKWAPILESGKAIESEYTKLALAQVLENTRNEFARKGMLTEAGLPGKGAVTFDGTLGNMPIDGDKSTGVMKGKFGLDNGGADNYGNFYNANIVMPMLRRIFPDLIANELVGVQPLNGPIGFALAYRAKYNKNGIVSDGTLTTDYEVGYNPTDTRYAGISNDAVISGPASETDVALKAYFGANDELKAAWTGEGIDTRAGEYASMANGGYPTMTFDLVKVGVEAKTRKLGAEWSPELAEDMEATQGLDVEAEMVNLLSYEIGAEIDRQIITEMVKAAITGGSVTSWSPVSADGLDQMGRLATLLTQITIEANQIAIRTKRGAANFVIASPKVCALLEQMTMNKFVSMGNAKSIPGVPYSGVGAIQKQGLINDGQQLLVRDAYAKGDYVLMGYKGTHPGDSGIIYCPYIPVQLSRVLRPDTFTPAIGARTRYGVMNSPWDASRYYTMMAVTGLENTIYGGVTADRTFIAPVTPITY